MPLISLHLFGANNLLISFQFIGDLSHSSSSRGLEVWVSWCHDYIDFIDYRDELYMVNDNRSQSDMTKYARITLYIKLSTVEFSSLEIDICSSANCGMLWKINRLFGLFRISKTNISIGFLNAVVLVWYLVYQPRTRLL